MPCSCPFATHPARAKACLHAAARAVMPKACLRHDPPPRAQGSESKLRWGRGEDGVEVGCIPSCEFSSGLDGSLVGGGADEVEGEMPDGGHVSGAVALAQAGEVFGEGDVEHPVEAVLDCPVFADGLQGNRVWLTQQSSH